MGKTKMNAIQSISPLEVLKRTSCTVDFLHVLKWGVVGCLLILAMGVGGCGSTKTTTTLDPNGKPVTVTEEHSFWYSENLAAHYENETKRSDNQIKSIELKINAIKENAQRRMQNTLTATEALLANVIDGQMIAAINTNAPQPGKEPKTAADQNWSQWALVLLQGWNLYNNRDSNSYQNGDGPVTINNNGSGDFFWHSNNNKNQTANLDNGSSWELDSSNRYKPTIDSHDTVDNHATRGNDSYGLQLF